MSNTILNDTGSVTTILGMYLQFNSLASLSFFEPYKNCTINNKRNVLPNIMASSAPSLLYFGVGINGFHNTDSQTGAERNRVAADNWDLYEPLPIRMIPVAGIANAGDLSMYRMRTLVTVNGVEYYQYWLKKLTWNPQRVEIIQKNAAGVESVYTPNPQNLSPTPPAGTTGGVVDVNQNRVIVRMTGIAEVKGSEIMEAINILHGGNRDLARISEFGFYTGEERAVDANGNLLAVGATGVRTEAAYVMLNKHKCMLGMSLEESGSILTQQINFEHSACIEG